MRIGKFKHIVKSISTYCSPVNWRKPVSQCLMRCIPSNMPSSLADYENLNVEPEGWYSICTSQMPLSLREFTRLWKVERWRHTVWSSIVQVHKFVDLPPTVRLSVSLPEYADRQTNKHPLKIEAMAIYMSREGLGQINCGKTQARQE